MKDILSNSLVGLALLASVGYAVMSLGPKSLRRALLAMLSGWARVLGLTRLAERWAAVSAKTEGACGGCDNCGSEQTAPTSSSQPNSQGEVRVPLTKIGKRV